MSYPLPLAPKVKLIFLTVWLSNPRSVKDPVRESRWWWWCWVANKSCEFFFFSLVFKVFLQKIEACEL